MNRWERFCLVAILLMMATAAGAGDAPVPFADYRTESWYLPQSPAVSAGPGASFFNPAAWAMTDQGALDLWWRDKKIRGDLDNYGLAFGRGLGFAMRQNTFGTTADNFRVYDYMLGLSHGTRAGTFGLGYRWAHGETDRLPRQKALSAGFIGRPSRYLTVGGSGTASLESDAAQAVFDLGLRPLGKSWFTLFADWTVNHDQAFFKDGSWGAGLEVRPLRGLHLGAKWRDVPLADTTEWQINAGVTIGLSHWSGAARHDEDGEHLDSTYLLRLNPPFAGLRDDELQLFGKKSYFFPISLENKVVTYQRYRYFDDTRVAWLDLMHVLHVVRDSDRIQGVALNLAGTRFRSSLLWEMRQEILALKAAGKEVIVHLDRADARLYYLASAADRITMDPMGGLTMPGMALSRSYLKGTLEKLGLGFQELRFFKYKSAVETLSRDHMSEADREQRQRIVDVYYETIRDAMARSRGLEPEQLDNLIDEMAEMRTSEAVAHGLVDAAGRWDQMGAWLGENRGTGYVPDGILPPYQDLTDEPWGPLPTIPVVYTVGECDMDSGIKGRATSAYLRGLVHDPGVVAVVLRADSPGGDPLPSDLITDAVRQLKEAGKPVIVSQGDLAASGGYWISMEGSQILTTPLTLTGSIGVISGWLYDDGLADKAGITSDVVSRGEHADLFSTVSIPFIGGVPRRAMSDDELARGETVIRAMYDDFIKAVAQGRGMDKEAVHEVAQGRVWMGGDAIEHGLCDEFGGLGDAIEAARQQAGLGDRRYTLVEYPPQQLFELPSLLPRLPSLLGVGDRINNLVASLAPVPEPVVEPAAGLPLDLPAGLDRDSMLYLRALNEAVGGPLLMMSPDLLPAGWRGAP